MDALTWFDIRVALAATILANYLFGEWYYLLLISVLFLLQSSAVSFILVVSYVTKRSLE